MPAYKDDKGKWFCAFYFEDWQGERKKKYKRGFSSKKEALEWESRFKLQHGADMDMLLSDFVEVYFSDKDNVLKERTKKNKRYMIDRHVTPFLGKKRMNEITASDIIQWQNEMMKLGYSQTYLRMIQNQLTALFNHAMRIYDLINNPCKKVKRMGKADADGIEFWTIEEYERFISVIPDGSRYHTLFEILFYTGMRIGEALALTKADIDFEGLKIHISKTYYRTDGRDVITKPKTEQSIRTIEIPPFLAEEIKTYTERMFFFPENERLFPVIGEAVQHMLKKKVEESGVKKIRVHDFRHSHVAYLINQGIDPLIIKERLGHKDIGITLNTYGHLYPSKQRQVAELLQTNKNARNG